MKKKYNLIIVSAQKWKINKSCNCDSSDHRQAAKKKLRKIFIRKSNEHPGASGDGEEKIQWKYFFLPAAPKQSMKDQTSNRAKIWNMMMKIYIDEKREKLFQIVKL